MSLDRFLDNNFRFQADPSVVTTAKVAGEWTVERALANIQIPAEASESPVPYFYLLEHLKTTKREGWKRFGINRFRPRDRLERLRF